MFTDLKFQLHLNMPNIHWFEISTKSIQILNKIKHKLILFFILFFPWKWINVRTQPFSYFFSFMNLDIILWALFLSHWMKGALPSTLAIFTLTNTVDWKSNFQLSISVIFPAQNAPCQFQFLSSPFFQSHSTAMSPSSITRFNSSETQRSQTPSTNSCPNHHLWPHPQHLPLQQFDERIRILWAFGWRQADFSPYTVQECGFLDNFDIWAC